MIPIISTKLHIPPPPRTLVPRRRLTARLEIGLAGKLILVSAPAGFGKTSLLAEWVAERTDASPAAWLHLDEGDNQPARFLAYLIAALRTAQADIGEGALSGLQAVPPVPVEAILTSLINEIDSLGRELILILDDYHLIETASIHAAVDFLLEHLPANLHPVIATRTDPPLPLHRLRARRELFELRAADLRFTQAETQQLLLATLGDELPPGQVAILEKRLEGWAAGLQMLAISLQGKQDVNAFIHSFGASHRYIMDYLSEEIYKRQTPEIQDFLLRTSLLERLCAPLCDAVLFANQVPAQERSPSAQVLAYLEGANLFLLPMDDERRWYRYHPLFAGVLRERLRQTHPDEIQALLKRASSWCAENGQVEAAFNYSLAAEDLQAAAQLVQENAMQVLKRGDLATLSTWLGKLPESTIFENPWLSAFQGWVLLLTGRMEKLELYLAAAESVQANLPQDKPLLGQIAAQRAYALAMQAQAGPAIQSAGKAFDLLPEDDKSVRCILEFMLGGLYLMQGDVPRAYELMRLAALSGEQAGNLHLAVSALGAQADLLLADGKLDTAKQVCEHALGLGTGSSGRVLPFAAGIYARLAEIHLARRQPGEARRRVDRSLALAGEWGNVDALAGGYLVLARVAHAEGDSGAARAALEQARTLAQTHILTPDFRQRFAAYEALILHSGPAQVPGIPLVEALSERELEVLQLMAQGHSNPDIAEELVVALGTVKAHSSSIYRKLDVRSRTQAVLRARELGLLSPD